MSERCDLPTILTALQTVADNNTATLIIGEDVATLMDYIDSLEKAKAEARRLGRVEGFKTGQKSVDWEFAGNGQIKIVRTQTVEDYLSLASLDDKSTTTTEWGFVNDGVKTVLGRSVKPTGDAE